MTSPRPRIAAIIPVLNEAGAIATVVKEMPVAWVDRVIVVDGGSTDETVAAAQAAGADVLVETRRGYGRACASGAAAAAADILVFLDGDGSDKPEFIPRLVQPLIAGTHDFVIASRVLGKREKGSMGLHQIAAGLLIGRAVGWLSGVHYTDMCAFRAIRARDLDRLGMREMTYGWNLEMQMRAARSGLRVLEIPVDYRCRIAGDSKVAGTFRGSIKAGLRIISTLIRVAREARSTTPMASASAQQKGIQP